MGDLKRSPCVLVALNVFGFLIPSLPLFWGGSVVSWIQRLNAAGSGLLLLLPSAEECKHCTGIQKCVSLLVCHLKNLAEKH